MNYFESFVLYYNSFIISYIKSMFYLYSHIFSHHLQQFFYLNLKDIMRIQNIKRQIPNSYMWYVVQSFRCDMCYFCCYLLLILLPFSFVFDYYLTDFSFVILCAIYYTLSTLNYFRSIDHVVYLIK